MPADRYLLARSSLAGVDVCISFFFLGVLLIIGGLLWRSAARHARDFPEWQSEPQPHVDRLSRDADRFRFWGRRRRSNEWLRRDEAARIARSLADTVAEDMERERQRREQ